MMSHPRYGAQQVGRCKKARHGDGQKHCHCLGAGIVLKGKMKFTDSSNADKPTRLPFKINSVFSSNTPSARKPIKSGGDYFVT